MYQALHIGPIFKYQDLDDFCVLMTASVACSGRRDGSDKILVVLLK